MKQFYLHKKKGKQTNYTRQGYKICTYPYSGPSTLVLRTHCPACFRRFPAPTHLISMNSCQQASAELDNNPFFRIRCVGAGNHLKHTRQ